MPPAEDLRLDPDDLRHQQFPSSFRGYEANAVNAAMHTLASHVERLNRWIGELIEENERLRAGTGVVERAAAVTVIETVAEPAPQPVLPASGLADLDEADLVALIGEETARVLGTARRAAEEIKSKAEESAARSVRAATEEAQATRTAAADDAQALRQSAATAAETLRSEAAAEAEALTAEARTARDGAVAAATEAAEALRTEVEAEVEALRQGADDEVVAMLAEAEAQLDAARSEAAAIVDDAKHQGRAMLEEAKAVRSRMLDDLSERRRLGRAQLQRLEAGRGELLAAYAAVRADLDRITETLLPADAAEAPPIVDDSPDLVEAIDAVARIEPVLAVDAAQPAPRPEVAVSTTDTDPAVAPSMDAGEPEDATDATGTAAPQQVEPPDDHAASDGDGPSVVAESSPEASLDDAGERPDMEDPAGSAPQPVVDLRQPLAEGEGGVDELFARIRADRTTSVDDANAVLDRIDDAAAAADEPEQAVVAVAERVLDIDAELLEHRASVIAARSPAVHKAIKRVLADEQNEVLDGLRRTGTVDVDAFLPALDDHLLSYAAVASAPLQAVADDAAGAAGVADIESIVRTLAAAIVEPFRGRIERSASDASDADELDDRLRSLYREWKTQQLTPVIDDAVLAAFAAGQFESFPSGAAVVWRIDPAQGPCPDAEDNALSGAIAKGDVFPTGDTCPQAHPGCRCLIEAAH